MARKKSFTPVEITWSQLRAELNLKIKDTDIIDWIDLHTPMPEIAVVRINGHIKVYDVWPTVPEHIVKASTIPKKRRSVEGVKDIRAAVDAALEPAIRKKVTKKRKKA